MSTPPAPTHAFWASADEWRAGFVMLGANVDTIPTPLLSPLLSSTLMVSGELMNGRYTHSRIALNFRTFPGSLKFLCSL